MMMEKKDSKGTFAIDWVKIAVEWNQRNLVKYIVYEESTYLWWIALYRIGCTKKKEARWKRIDDETVRTLEYD